MFNHLKRRYSIDEPDKSQFNKRTKVLSDIPSPENYDYTDLYSSPITNPLPPYTTQLPLSPPVINDPSTPISLPSSSSIDTTPTLKRFIISTRQQQQQENPTIDSSNYVDINNLLYHLHLRRSSTNNHHHQNGHDIEVMMDDDVYQYNTVNAVLRQAFLERHPISK